MTTKTKRAVADMVRFLTTDPSVSASDNALQALATRLGGNIPCEQFNQMFHTLVMLLREMIALERTDAQFAKPAPAPKPRRAKRRATTQSDLFNQKGERA